jgi:MFS family permease
MTEATNTTFAARRGGDARVVASVSTAHFVSHFYILSLPPLFAFVKADFGVSYTELALAITVFMVVSALLQTPAGFLVDRGNPRLILVAGLLCGMAGLIIAAFSHSYWVFVAMFGLMGIGNTVYHPADYALLARHVSAERMSQAYSVHTFAGMLGSAVAPAGMLAMHALFGWRGAFIGAAALGLVAVAVLLLLRDSESERPAKQRTQGATAGADWRLLTSAPILMNFLFFTLLAFAGFGFMNFSVVALGALYDTPVSTANAALSGYLVLSALGVLAGGFVATRTSRHGLTAVIGILIAAAATFVIAMFNLDAPLLIAVASLAGFSLGLIMPARDMIVRSVTPPGAFGKVFGFVTNGFNIGGIISPLVFGPLMDHGEPRLVFIVIAVGGLAGIATVASLPRRPATP